MQMRFFNMPYWKQCVIALLVAVVLGVVAGLMRAQSITPTAQPGQFNHTVQTKPGAIPTSLTCVVGAAGGCLMQLPAGATDPYLCGADFTATGQTITMQDGQSTPVPWVIAGGTLGSAGSPTGWIWQSPNDSGCRWFPGGLYIQAGATGATGRMTIKFNQ